MIPTILTIIWAGLLFGGWAFGPADSYRRMPLWSRLASSGVLVALAGWSALARPTSFTLLIALGMLLGLVGDLYMAKLISWPRPHVLGGMGSFGLGHLAYIAACLGAAAGLPWGLRTAAWLTWLVLGGSGWYLLVWRPAPDGRRTLLHRAALPYALLLASTAGAATGVALFQPAFWLFAVGAALFLLSDLLIAVDLFNGRRFFMMGDVIWLTYGPAQALIVLTGLFFR